MKNSIVLFKGRPFDPKYQEFNNFPYRAPLTLLSLASPLIQEGFNVIVIDHRLDIDVALKKIESVLDDLLFIGVSVLTGFEIADGLHISEMLKKKDPTIPSIWGGWHVCCLPEETLEDPRVDIVVKNIGQNILVNIAKRLQNNINNFSDIPGVFTKNEKTCQQTFTDSKNITSLQNIPLPAYELIDLEYLRKESTSLLSDDEYKGLKLTGSIDYVTSFGCSNRCSYCCNPKVYGSSWFDYPVEKVVQQIKWLYDEKGFNHFNFIDAEFTMRYKHLKLLLEKLISENIDICWSAQAAVSGILNLQKHGLLPLVEKSGCYRLAIGAESGSERILKYMNKKQTVNTIIQAANLLKDNNIPASFNCLTGLPVVETFDDIYKTFHMAFELKKISSEFSFPIAFYTPLPGSDMFEDSINSGFIAPQSLEEWGKYSTSYNSISEKIPWRNLKKEKLVKHFITFYLPLSVPGNITRGTVTYLKKHLKEHPLRWLIFIGHKLSLFRIKHSWFKIPFEYYLFNLYQRFCGLQYIPGGRQK